MSKPRPGSKYKNFLTSDRKYLFQPVKNGTIIFQMRRKDLPNGKIVLSTETNIPREARIKRAELILKYSMKPEAIAEVRKAVTVEELVNDYVADLYQRHKVTAPAIEAILKKKVLMHKAYKDRTAASITSDDNKAYRAHLRADGWAEATCDNHLTYLRSAFIYGQRKQSPPKVTVVPNFPILNLDNARTEFIEVDGYRVILSELPKSMKMFFVLAFHSGTRSGKLCTLKWNQVNFTQRIVGFDPTQTENKMVGKLPFYGDVEPWLLKEKAQQIADCVYSETGFVCRVPETEYEYRKLWREAVDRARLVVPSIPKNLIIHDLRRSAVTRMIEVFNMDEAAVMLMVGHKTRAMCDRYHIRNTKAIQGYGAQMDAKIREIAEKSLAASASSTAAI
jgi:integrase